MKRHENGIKLYFQGQEGRSAFINHHKFERSMSLAPYDGNVGIPEQVYLHYHFKTGLEVTVVDLCSHKDLADLIPALRAGQAFNYLDELWEKYASNMYATHLYKLETGQPGNRMDMEGRVNYQPTFIERLQEWFR